MSSSDSAGPTVAQMIEDCKAFYEKPDNIVGGHLHIVLEDGNVEDGNVQFCIDEAHAHGDLEAAALGEDLLQMSRAQRLKVYDGIHA